MQQIYLYSALFWTGIVLVGCGGAVAEQERIDVSHVLPNYRALTPANATIFNNPQPLFHFERDTDNHSTSNPCKGAHPDILVASAKAYINALNKLAVAEKRSHTSI